MNIFPCYVAFVKLIIIFASRKQLPGKLALATYQW